MELSKQEIERYSRHLMLPEIGVEGQKKLKEAKVLLIGAGGLGSPLAVYLAAAGVGTLGIVDFDVVDASNLQRQIIHYTEDIGRLKTVSAKEKINRLNPEVRVRLHETPFRSDNAMDIARDYDILVDGTDNFPTRYLVNDVCVMMNKVNVYGSIYRFEGQVTVFHYQDGPCYRCLFPQPPDPGLIPSCAEGGVIGILPGIIGLLQANETVKIICGIGESLKGRLLTLDALAMKFKEFRIRRDVACVVCGDHPSVRELIDYDQFCGVPGPQGAPDEADTGIGSILQISVHQLAERLKAPDPGFILVDVREPHEYELGRIEGSVLKPLSSLSRDFASLPRDKELILYCRVGRRSQRAAEFLKSEGFVRLTNVQGGIHAWAQEIDPSIPVL